MQSEKVAFVSGSRRWVGRSIYDEALREVMVAPDALGIRHALKAFEYEAERQAAAVTEEHEYLRWDVPNAKVFSVPVGAGALIRSKKPLSLKELLEKKGIPYFSFSASGSCEGPRERPCVVRTYRTVQYGTCEAFHSWARLQEGGWGPYYENYKLGDVAELDGERWLIIYEEWYGGRTTPTYYHVIAIHDVT